MEIVGTRGQILMAKYPLPIPYPPGRLDPSLLTPSAASQRLKPTLLLPSGAATGSAPSPTVGDYSAPHLAGFKGPTSKGREERKDGSTRHYTFPSFIFCHVYVFFLFWTFLLIKSLST